MDDKQLTDEEKVELTKQIIKFVECAIQAALREDLRDNAMAVGAFTVIALTFQKQKESQETFEKWVQDNSASVFGLAKLILERWGLKATEKPEAPHDPTAMWRKDFGN